MKKNIFTIFSATAIIFALIILATCTNKDNRTEKQSLQATTAQLTQVTIQKTTIQQLANCAKAYNTVINDTLKECKEKYPYETSHGGYGLYDFDNDSIPELFLEVYGSTMPDCYIHIYDFNSDEAVLIDSIQSAHSWVYGTNSDNAFLTECCWMGESVWSIYELKNGEFVSQKLASFYPDGFGDSIEPQENPLPGMGYEIEEIKYYFLDDLSGLSM